MTHDPVDRLLEDLDRALSVQPSPALTAQVRRHIGAHRPSTSTRLRIWTLPAVAAAAALVTSYVALTPSNVEAPVVERASVSAAPEAGTDAPQSGSTSAAVETVAVPLARSIQPQPPAATDDQSRAALRPDPVFDVVISPADRLGLEQLQTAVSSGRITSEMLASVEVSLQPTMVVPTFLAVPETPVQVGAPRTPPGNRGLDGIDVAVPGGPRLLPGSAPSSFTRSAS